MSDPKPTRSNPPGRERRVFVRVPPKSASPVLSVSEQEEIITWKARVRDISVGGVCLLLNGTFKPGTMLDIAFTNPRTNQTRTLLAKVVRNETKDDVHWAVACSFMQKLTEAELDALTE